MAREGVDTLTELQRHAQLAELAAELGDVPPNRAKRRQIERDRRRADRQQARAAARMDKAGVQFEVKPR